MSTATPTLTAQEVDVLGRHARGMDLAAIAADLGIHTDKVNEIVMRLSTFNRSRSAELVRQHALARQPRIKTPPPAPVQVGRSFTRPQTTVQEIQTVTSSATLEQLLTDAEATGLPAARKTAQRIRNLAEQLARLVETHREEDRARTKIARLKAELAAEEAKLKNRSKAKALGVAELPAANVPTKVIRAWAAEFGIDCASHGQIPIDVRKAYVAAHPDGV